MKQLTTTLIALTLGVGAHSASYLGVGTIVKKDPEYMHARSCTVAIDYLERQPSDQITRKIPPHHIAIKQANARFSCEGLYENISVGSQLVGDISWYCFDPGIVPGIKPVKCHPSFVPKGKIAPF